MRLAAVLEATAAAAAGRAAAVALETAVATAAAATEAVLKDTAAATEAAAMAAMRFDFRNLRSRCRKHTNRIRNPARRHRTRHC